MSGQDLTRLKELIDVDRSCLCGLPGCEPCKADSEYRSLLRIYGPAMIQEIEAKREYIEGLERSNAGYVIALEASSEIEAERNTLREMLRAVEQQLVDAQPHVAQGLEDGEVCAEFLDAHIDMALKACRISPTGP